MSKAITSLGGSGPREIMVDAATIAGTAEEIAAVIGVVEVGTRSEARLNSSHI